MKSLPNEPSDQSKWFTDAMKAEEVIGATDEYGDLQFLIKWKDVPQADLVPSKIANIKIPQVEKSLSETHKLRHPIQW